MTEVLVYVYRLVDLISYPPKEQPSKSLPNATIWSHGEPTVRLKLIEILMIIAIASVSAMIILNAILGPFGP